MFWLTRLAVELSNILVSVSWLLTELIKHLQLFITTLSCVGQIWVLFINLLQILFIVCFHLLCFDDFLVIIFCHIYCILLNGFIGYNLLYFFHAFISYILLYLLDFYIYWNNKFQSCIQ